MNEIYAEILRYAKAMWRYRWISLAFAWAVTITGWGMVITLPDKYESQARIYVDTGSLLAPLLSGLTVRSDLDQEIMIMQRTLLSRPNLEQVMRMNDLDLTTTNPGEVEALIAGLAGSISISAQTQNLFSISYSHTNPRQAQSVVQSLLTIFVENNLGQSRKDMEGARGFIEKQINEYESQLQKAEQIRAAFQVKNGLFLGKGGSFAAKLEEDNEELRLAKEALQDAEIRRDELRRQLAAIPEFIASQGGSPIDSRIAGLEESIDNLKLSYTDKHPDVVSQVRLLAALREQKSKQGPAVTSGMPNPLYENVRIKVLDTETNIASLLRRVREAERSIEKNRLLAQTAPRIEAELSDLNRDYSVLKGNYEQLLARRESARISQAQEATSSAVQFRIIDPPQLPIVASSPKRAILYALSLLAGLGIGGGVAFLMASLNDSFITSAQLSATFGLPVLGRISLIRNAAEELRMRKDYWRFGLATGSLVASLAFMVVLGPRLVSLMNKLGSGSVSSLFSGSV